MLQLTKDVSKEQIALINCGVNLYMWVCSICEIENSDTSRYCFICGGVRLSRDINRIRYGALIPEEERFVFKETINDKPDTLEINTKNKREESISSHVSDRIHSMDELKDNPELEGDKETEVQKNNKYKLIAVLIIVSIVALSWYLSILFKPKNTDSKAVSQQETIYEQSTDYVAYEIME